MKKILTLIVLFITIASIPLMADSDLAIVGFTAGYSSKDNTALIGFNGAYNYYASVDPAIGIGYGIHGDMLFGVNHQDTFLMSFGFVVGLGLQFQLLEDLSLNFLLGPAVVAETGVMEPSVGLGAGLDASVSYFIGDSKAIGFTVGTTIYPQFFIFDDIRDDNFSIMANGYVAMSMRFPASIIALPVLDFILD